MDNTRSYEIEGLKLDIPVQKDENTSKLIEIYPDFIEEPIWTPKGHRVLFCGTDACPTAAEATPGGCPDCGSCKYFKRAAERTWFGICTNERSPLNDRSSKENM